MKKLILSVSIIGLCAAFAPAALAQNAPSVSFQNITTTGATISFSTGYDNVGSMIQNRQPMKVKYRAVSSTDSAPAINGTETEIPLVFTVNSQVPVQPITLSGLKTNQRYAVWVGQQAVQQCLTTVSCASVYMQYNPQPFLFSTKLDSSKVAILNKNLSFQAKSTDVVLLKKYFAAHNFMELSTSKQFDIPTLVGVIKFQLANNMTADGTVGSGSRTIINSWLVQQAQN